MIVYKPILLLLRSVGIYPLNRFRIAFTEFGCIYNFVYHSVKGYNALIQSGGKYSWFQVMDTISSELYDLNHIMFLLHVCSYYSSYQEIWDRLEAARERLAQPQQLRRQKQVFMLTLVLTACMIVTSTVSTFRETISFCIITIGYTIIQLYQPILVSIVLESLESLNAKLKEIKEKLKTTPEEDDVTKLKSSLALYYELQNIVRLINTTFSWYTLMLLANRLLFLTRMLHGVLRSISTHGTVPIINVANFCFGVAYAVIIALVTDKSHWEADKSVAIVHSMMRTETIDSQKRLYDTINDFSLSCWNNKVRFTAGGIFNITLNTVVKTIAGSITALTVLLQLIE